MTFLIQQTLIYAVPLMIVALAGVFAERSGIINLALEGIMVFGAFIGVWFVRILQTSDAILALKQSGNWVALQGVELLTMLVAAIFGALFSLLLSFASINLRADQTIGGTALNLMAPALVLFFIRIIANQNTLQMLTGDAASWFMIKKSTLGIDFARAAALHHNMTSVVFSLEMSKVELAQRIISAETNIPMAALRRADDITPERWNTLNQFWTKMQNAPLFIDDSPNMSLMEIRAKCRRLKQTNDLKLVVIDYLQLMTSGKAVESRQQEVSEFSRALKLLAKELEVPVVALSQLNRGPEMRNDKKPQLSDLRESGSIEQDADVVFLVHRPDFYDKEDRPGEADIIMAKHRNGPTETFHLAFLGATSKFKDMPQDYNANQGV